MDEGISTFVAITGATSEVARSFVEMAAGDPQRAIELYFENPDLVSGVGADLSASTAQPPPAANARVIQQRTREIIHIDSDDDDEDMSMDAIDVDADEGDELNARAVAQHAAVLAQEEEDAAMAKRLQEELYQGGSAGLGDGGMADVDGVRAPIARTTETLVAPDADWGPLEQDTPEMAFLQRMRQGRQPQARSGGPFGQRIWSDGPDPPPASAEDGSHARRLEDLFRPPYDIMARVTWDGARTQGKDEKKWILVNLQDMNDFNCQALNRDIWKDQAIKSLVSEHFIFLQYDKDYPDAEEYITFYLPNRTHENPDNYPHVSIIDPRTGEQVKVWCGRPFPDAPDFFKLLVEFLDRYSLAANSKNPVASAATRQPQPVDVDRMTEDEMLEMALKNSLANNHNDASAASGSNANTYDPDALTKIAQPGTTTASQDNHDVNAAAGTQQDVGHAAATTMSGKSPFANISVAHPHIEPANDPATTTRIQFRHPNGRLIRRFALSDPVRRLYEWLKAEPLDGKDGVEFELKKMPQGQDLIENLGQTVEEVGLKQGTVMVEFLDS